MPTIDLEILDALACAMDDVNINPSMSDFIGIIRGLDDRGFRIECKPERVTLGSWPLNEADSRKFIDLLLNSPEPNEALKDAAMAYKAMAELSPAVTGWFPWPGSRDQMWRVDICDESATAVRDPEQFLRWEQHLVEGAAWIMVQAKDADDAMKIWRNRGCQETDQLTIDGVGYPFIYDGIPF